MNVVQKVLQLTNNVFYLLECKNKNLIRVYKSLFEMDFT